MTYVIRSKSSRFYATLMFAAVVVILVASAVNGGLQELLWATPAALFVAAVAWVLFLNPRLEIGPGGLEVVNMFRTHVIPWADLHLVENRWGLYLYTSATSKKVSVWAVPSEVGVLNNSWRNRKKTPESPDIDWPDSGRVSRIGSVKWVADVIELRRKQIRTQPELRRKLQGQTQDYWPDAALTRVQAAPIVALLATAALTALMIYTTR